jgi:hypothetical protein
MTQEPALIINPRDDTKFGDFVEELVTCGALTTDGLRALLREQYPLAEVHERQLSGERVLVWYVYRDGRWIRPGGAVRGSVRADS